MYDDLIAAASALYSVPVDWIRAFISVESSWDPNALSTAGARGLMQIMPATALGYGVTDPESLYDPSVNIDIGTHLLSDLRAEWGNAIEPVASAYYSGGGLNYQTNPDVAAYVDKIKAALGSLPPTSSAAAGLIVLGLVAAYFATKK